MHNDAVKEQTLTIAVDYIDDLTQDNEVKPLTYQSVGKLILRAEELQLRIEKQFLFADVGDHNVDSDLIEHMAREIETIEQKIENLPVNSLAVAKMKIAFFMKMLQSDHPDPTKVDIFKGKILGVFANYAAAQASEDCQLSQKLK